MAQLDRAIYTGSKFKPHEAFWRGLAEEYPSGFEFRQKRKGNLLDNSTFRVHTFMLAPELADNIHSITGRKENSTLVCMLSAFSLLLTKYAQEDKVIIDSPLHKSLKIENAVTSKVPLAVEVKSDSTFKAHLSKVQDLVKHAYTYQNYPLDLIGMPSALATNVLLSYHHTHHEISDSANYDLIADIEREGETFQIELRYKENLFQDHFIQHIEKHFSNIIASLGDLEVPVSDIDILTEQEKQHILSDFNITERAFPHDKVIPELFEEHVQNNPDQLALVFQEKQLTYAELNEKVNQLAHHLREEFKIGPGQFVGVMVDKSEMMVIGILGVLKAGAAYIPLDPKLPSDRIDYILEDTKIATLLTQIDYFYNLPNFQGNLFMLDVQLESLETAATDPEIINVPCDPAYVIYTSGSTGKPKGVVVEHMSVANLCKWQAAQYGVAPGKNILQFFSYSFDGAVGETFMALLNGATMRMFDTNKLEVEELLNFINNNEVAVGVFVPSLLKQLDPAQIRRSKELWVVSVGEECPTQLAEKWAKSCRFANAYGPTEYTVYSHLWEVDPTEIDDTVPIGKPMFNSKSYILDRNLNPLPVGIAGEMYISGAGLAKGYLNNREMTLTRFVPNPFFLSKQFTDQGALAFEGSRHEIDLFKKERSATVWDDLINEEDVPDLKALLPLVEKLDDDLALLTKDYLAECEKNQQKFRSFRRYFLEAFNDTYASCGINEEVLKAILATDDFAGKKGVDFGFGNAEVMMSLKTLGAEVSGIELSPFSVLKARNKGLSAHIGEVDLKKGDFFDHFDLERGTLDFAISNLLLDRVEHPYHLIENIFEALKEGGRFAIQTLLPVIPVDDGDVDNKITYTPARNLLTAGRSLEEDKFRIIQVLYSLGASDITVRQIPFVVSSRDGVQEYTAYSFSGAKGEVPPIEESVYCMMYKTGDHGLYLPDGKIDFIGRVDDQVKLRGFRIELGEIESNILAYDGIKDVKVVVRDDTGQDKMLVAYCAADEEIPVEDLTKFLKKRLPVYMVPSFFVRMDALPLNNSGKVDKNALPKPQGIAVDEDFKAPNNPIEEQIQQIWVKVLKQEDISVTANFFSIGGHSLKATQMLYFIHKEMDVKLDLSAVFENPTIEGLAAQVATKSKSVYEHITKAEERPYYPLAHAQKRIWLAIQLGADSAAFNIPVAYKFKGKIDLDKFRKAFDLVIERHESLRTTFITIDNQPYQRIEQEGQAAESVTIINLEDGQEVEKTVAVYCGQEERRVFDLEHGPLMVAKLLQTAGDEYVFLLNFHHIITDGWSMDMFVNEVLEAYEKGEEADLPALNIQYKDYALWEEKQIASGRLEESKRYWMDKLQGDVQELEIVIDHPRPSIKTYNGDNFSINIDKETSNGIIALSEKSNISLFNTLFSFVNVLLYKYSGQNSITLGTPVAGRDHADLERQIGVFLNMLPIVNKFNVDDTIQNAIDKVKQSLFDAYQHQTYPFDQIVEDLAIDANPSRSPLFDVVVQMMDNVINQDKAMDSVEVESYPLGQKMSKHDLTFFFREFGEGINLRVEYNTDLFRVDTIEKLSKNFLHVVSQVLESTDTLLQDLHLLTEKDEAKEMDDFMQSMYNV
ncbi:MAG: amino acid adenylation domain-containing protein [Bacteroidota bacterium]